MNYIYRVSVKAPVRNCWWIVYEGNDYETADAIYRAHKDMRRTVMEKI
jgi:hypothetical protein